MRGPASKRLLAALVSSLALIPGPPGRADGGATGDAPGDGSTGGLNAGAADPVSCDAGVATAFADYLGRSPQDLGCPCRLAEAVQGFQIVVVTIADPIDSRLDSAFDETLKALHLAATQLKYTLDRYWLPWQPDQREAAAGQGPGRCHTDQPGVVLYRPTHARTKGTNVNRPGLAFLLVGETPTTGVHRRSLLAALRIAGNGRDWRRVTVVGPTFSGAGTSLARELRDPQFRGWRFELVTGSATAQTRENAFDDPPTPMAFLSGAAPPDPVSLRATVHTDAELWRALQQYLDRLGVKPEDTALLLESGTEFAASFHGAATGATRNESTTFQPATILRFPMQIARVRADYDRHRPKELDAIAGHAIPQQAVDLPADARRAARRDPKDILPALSDLSVNYDDHVLTAELAMLRRRSIRAVGVIATDPLDKIFLVTRLREYVPDALIFTFESNLLFLHPTAQQAMYGTLVVSTYPLLADTQSWTAIGPARGRFQFAGSAAQGIYNAAILALEPSLDPAPLLTPDGKPVVRTHLADYGCPLLSAGACACQRLFTDGAWAWARRPPAWISVVGRDALWPVSLAGCGGKDDAFFPAGNVAAWQPSQDGLVLPRRVRVPEPSGGMVLLAALLSGLVVFTALGSLVARCLGLRLPLHERFLWSWRLRRGWLALHFGWLATITLVVSVLLHLPEKLVGCCSCPVAGRIEGSYTRALASVAASATGLALVAAAWAAWDLLRGHRATGLGSLGGPTSDHRQWLRRSRLGAGALVAGAVAATTVHFTALALAGWIAEEMRLDALLLAVRALNLGSGVSPLVPLLALALAIHLATGYQALRARLMAPYGAACRHGRLLSRFVDRDPTFERLDRRLALALRGRYRWRDGLLAAAFLAVPAALFIPAARRLQTPDGQAFRALFLVLLAAAIILSGLAQRRAWRLWGALRDALERLPKGRLTPALKGVPKLFGQRRARRLLWRAPQVQDIEACERALRDALSGHPGGAADRRLADSLAADRALAPCASWGHASLPQLARAAACVVRPVKSRSVAAAHRDHSHQLDTFTASQLALAVYWAVAHLRWLLAFSVAGAVSILLGIAFYPFAPMRLLRLIAWIAVLGAAGSAVVIYVQQARDEVLSWLGGSEPGSLSLDVSSALRFLTLGAAPVAALVALEFPTLGHWIAEWLGPFLGGGK